MSCLRNHIQVQGHENVLSCFLEDFKFCYSFSCYIDMYVFDSFWVDLCLWCLIRGLASFFCVWISSCLSTIWWRDYSLLYWIVLAPLPEISWPKKKGFVFFFCTQNYVPLVCVSIRLPGLRCLMPVPSNYALKLRSVCSPALFYFFKYWFCYLGSLDILHKF